jgi:hypothetical protein
MLLQIQCYYLLKAWDRHFILMDFDKVAWRGLIRNQEAFSKTGSFCIVSFPLYLAPSSISSVSVVISPFT